MTDKEVRSDGAATVQNQVEEALQESEERYRSILTTCLVGITIRENGEPGKGTQFEITVPTGAWQMNPDTNDVRGSKP
jgi:exo-beta-1,3-glucanase (GH17 family)